MVGQDAPQPQEGGESQIRRVFEQPLDALSTYSDLTQIVGTANEIILQFYESIPGIPGQSGGPEEMTTRLKATIVMSMAHAAILCKLLMERIPEQYQQGRAQ